MSSHKHMLLLLLLLPQWLPKLEIRVSHTAG
jgi:hypothetical protein